MARPRNRLPSTLRRLNDGAPATMLPCAACSRPGSRPSSDEEEGTATYLALRLRWDYLIAELAPHLGYSMVEIDPEGSCPGASDSRPKFDTRLRSE